MKNKTIISMLTAGALALVAQQGMANTITGEINMGGTATLNGPLATATADLGNSDVVVIPVETGSYASLVPYTTPVTTFNGFAFTGASVSPLWSFTVGTTTYSFDLSNDHIVSQSSSFLNLAGIGTLNITGDTSVTGNWTFTITSSTGVSPTFQFGFLASDNAAVPDGGLTVALLGGALTAMALVRSKSRKL